MHCINFEKFVKFVKLKCKHPAFKTERQNCIIYIPWYHADNLTITFTRGNNIKNQKSLHRNGQLTLLTNKTGSIGRHLRKASYKQCT